MMKLDFLKEFSTVVPRQQNTNGALALAKKINNPSSQSYALRAIAAAYGQLWDSNAALEGLKDLLKAAKKINYPLSQSYALRAIAATAGDITDPNIKQSILQDTLAVAEAANAGEAFVAISYQYAKDSAWGKALQTLKRCPEEHKFVAWANIINLYNSYQWPVTSDQWPVMS